VGVSIAAVCAAAALVATTVTGASSSSSGAPAAGQRHANQPRVNQPVNASTSGRTAEAQRLTTVLTGLMHDALPGARFSTSPIPAQLGEPAAGALEFADADTFFVAAATVTDTAGIENVLVTVGQPNDELHLERDCTNDPPPQDMNVQCHMEQAAGGALVQVLHTWRGAYQRDLVEILRADGNSVTVELMNTIHPYHAQRAGLNLSIDQLAALAKNPQLATTVSG
jgi:hypothetical protein